MKISVVIPVFNGRGVLEDCLEALLDYTGRHELQIIAIDDFSTDGSRHYLRGQNGIITLFNDRNYGYAHTVNSGLKHAGGEAVLFLNQDTVIEGEAIDILADKLFSDPEYGIVAPKLLNPDSSRQLSIRSFPNHLDIISHHLGLHLLFPANRIINKWKMPWFDYDSEAEVMQPMFSAVLIRREVVNHVGLLDERFPLFFNDVDYCRRVLSADYKIIYIPSAKVIHQHGQATSQNAMRSVYLQHKAFIDYLAGYYKGIRYLIPNLFCSVILIFSAHLRALYRGVKRVFTSRA